MLKPSIYNGKLRFLVSWWRKNGDTGSEVKSYITGRLTKILLVHFSDYFIHIETFHD